MEFQNGFSVSLYRDLKFTLNFSEVALPGDWLEVSKNGTLVYNSSKELTSRKADISIQQDTMRVELAAIVNFLHPTYPITVVAFARDTPVNQCSKVYFDPFGFQTWICIVLLMLGIWGSLHFMIWRHNKHQLIGSYSLDNDSKLKGESLIFMFGWISQQGWHTFPSAIPTRTIFLISQLSGVIFFSAYTAALVSKFSVRPTNVESFEDLIDQKYSFVVSNLSVTMVNYAEEFASYYKREVSVFEDISVFAKKIQNTNTALLYFWDSISDIFSSQYTNMREESFICDVISTFRAKRNYHSGMVLLKDSPFKEVFNHKIVKIKESGLNYRYIKHYEKITQPSCLPKSKIYHRTLSLQDALMPFCILLIGLGLAPTFLILERLNF